MPLTKQVRDKAGRFTGSVHTEPERRVRKNRRHQMYIGGGLITFIVIVLILFLLFGRG